MRSFESLFLCNKNTTLVHSFCQINEDQGIPKNSTTGKNWWNPLLKETPNIKSFPTPIVSVVQGPGIFDQTHQLQTDNQL